MNEELRGYYLGALPRRLDALESSLAAVAEDASARATLRRIAHSLKGSGGSYGFPRISASAAAAEAAGDDELPGRVVDLIEILRTTIGDAAQASHADGHPDPSED